MSGCAASVRGPAQPRPRQTGQLARDDEAVHFSRCRCQSHVVRVASQFAPTSTTNLQQTVDKTRTGEQAHQPRIHPAAPARVNTPQHDITGEFSQLGKTNKESIERVPQSKTHVEGAGEDIGSSSRGQDGARTVYSEGTILISRPPPKGH